MKVRFSLFKINKIRVSLPPPPNLKADRAGAFGYGGDSYRKRDTTETLSTLVRVGNPSVKT